MAVNARLAALCAVLLLACAQVRPARADANDMHHRMDDLVDSVKNAVHDAEAAGRKREVVDLGQTLHLLETKFSGLRTALQQELGGKVGKFSSHSNVAKELMDRSSELVQGIVSQRDELRKLQRDVKEVDSAIRAIREAMVGFDRDVAQLSKVTSDLHVSHSELHETHEETKETIHEVMAHHASQSKGGSSHMLFYMLIMAEIAVFVLYLYMKRPGSAVAHKAYGKFG